MRPFVVVSGLPGSGKSTLAGQLAPRLGLPVIDKDTILERLFESRGTGDLTWRRALSRESDRLFEEEAAASNGALLVSFWHQPGMPSDSGTPTVWIPQLSAAIVNVHCVCSPEIAAARYGARQRHSGHLDAATPEAQRLESLRGLVGLEPLAIGRKIEVNTAGAPDLDWLVREVRQSLTQTADFGNRIDQ